MTSYDSDAPVAENGALRPKFHRIRELLLATTGAAPRPLPADPPLLAPCSLLPVPGAGLLEGLAAPAPAVASPHRRLSRSWASRVGRCSTGPARWCPRARTS